MEDILRAAREGDEGAVSRLLDADPALLETADDNWHRPLTMAARHGQLGVVKLLVQRGANVNATGRRLRTALHQAADQGHEEVVAFLLEQGAKANGRDEHHMTSLFLACWEGHLGVAQMLLQQVGDQAHEDRDNRGLTALHYAADGGHEDVVALLLSQRAQEGIAANDGRTPLMCAFRPSHLGVVRRLPQHVRTQALEVRDRNGHTALHWAVCQGHCQVVRILLLAGADHTVMDNKGRTSLTLAQGPLASSDMAWLEEEQKRERQEVYANLVAVFEWWKGELKRGPLLERARCLHDASTTHRHTPAAPVPAFLQARAAAGQALPQVEVVAGQQEEQKEGASGKRGASSEAGSVQEAEEEEEEVYAVCGYVVRQLNEALYTELMQGFHCKDT